MQTSRFLAKLTGPVFLVIGLGMLLNRDTYQTVIAEGLRGGILLYLSGLLSLLAGLAMVNLHNTWTADWRVIITVLGWLMVVGGVIRIALPKVAVTVGSAVYGGSAAVIVVALIVIALGGFLSFKGYGRHA